MIYFIDLKEKENFLGLSKISCSRGPCCSQYCTYELAHFCIFCLLYCTEQETSLITLHQRFIVGGEPATRRNVNEVPTGPLKRDKVEQEVGREGWRKAVEGRSPVGLLNHYLVSTGLINQRLAHKLRVLNYETNYNTNRWYRHSRANCWVTSEFILNSHVRSNTGVVTDNSVLSQNHLPWCLFAVELL